MRKNQHNKSPQFDALLPSLITLTTEVGTRLMSLYQRQITATLKADQTPLTIADEQAHAMIISALKTLTPNVPVLSEEAQIPPFETRRHWQDYWLIDPLDGTRDFLDGTGEFCICIAYIRHNAPIFGLIYAPVQRTHFYTTEAQKSYKLHDNLTQKLQVKSKRQPLKIVIGHHSSHNPKLQHHLKSCGDFELNKLGSALKFCAIAQGDFDYYPRFGPCSEWDTAAGACILQGAGGRVLDECGKPLRYNQQTSLSSPIFFASGQP